MKLIKSHLRTKSRVEVEAAGFNQIIMFDNVLKHSEKQEMAVVKEKELITPHHPPLPLSILSV